ncbi:hypothetical protein EZV77_16980 [Burkholderia thailandensis]|nr:hypothetical protein AQ475_20560 [Burkholderia thailandensis]AVR28600.1 hypothetical protein A8H32_27535 [Burkholderia thailandensis]PJO68488.1 hypothetical protein CWD92_32330 [Burkholderia thailandensis]TBW61352.1 hypothetical protein EZV77_16980 [Burkholderia thailandensis]TGB31961.1 hypothetical protein C6946_20160 [Burkholderia thailandensis]
MHGARAGVEFAFDARDERDASDAPAIAKRATRTNRDARDRRAGGAIRSTAPLAQHPESTPERRRIGVFPLAA